MVEIVVNGETTECEENITLEALVGKLGYQKKRIAAEVNGEIVTKSEYENFTLKPADKLEIVSFVGGG